MQSKEQNNSSAYGVTHAKGKEFIYTWYINNFSCLLVDDRTLNSPHFDTNVKEKISWYLSIPSAESKNNDYLPIMLKIFSYKGGYDKKIYLTLSIVDCKCKERRSVHGCFIPQLGKHEGREFLKFIEKSYISNDENGLLLNGTLTIKCKMFFFDTVVISQSISLHKNKSCNCNLRDLFETKKLSDTTLIVGDQKFETHKCILASQSKVFSAMFEHDMKERNNNTVEINDVEPQVVEEMLQFIYGKKTEEFEDVFNLLIAADKYGIDELKKMCENQLVNDINVENIGKILVLADRYKADLLKKYVVQFIYSNPKEINFQQFKEDVESYSPFLIDMLRGLM